MKKLRANKLKTLKIVHLFFIALWFGGGISAVLISFLPSMANPEAIMGIYLAMEFIDYYAIVTGSLGCLITGIIYGVWTHWGFFKFKWVSAKWVVMIIQMVIGAAFLGQAVGSNVKLLKTLGSKAISNQQFMMNQNLIQFLGILQSVFLTFLIAISVLKPWKAERSSKAKLSDSINAT